MSRHDPYDLTRLDVVGLVFWGAIAVFGGAMVYRVLGPHRSEPGISAEPETAIANRSNIPRGSPVSVPSLPIPPPTNALHPKPDEPRGP